MNKGRLIISHLMDFIPKYEFDKCVQKYSGNSRARTFSCYDQFLCMMFAQLTGRESLRDIETCLNAMRTKRYHAGIRGSISRSTLADANENRDWRIYAEFTQKLIAIARDLYVNEDLAADLTQTAYALDSTTIDLCLELFPWAHFRKTKAAVKMHTLLDLRGAIPAVIIITTGKTHDVNILDEMIFEAGAIYVMDRGYMDFERLHRIHQSFATFVTRTKSNSQFTRLKSQPVDRSTGLRFDQTVRPSNEKSAEDYPDQLRLVKFHDAKRNKELTFMTNNFTLPALTIAQLYKYRWRVELFFKWIKQHLRIKSFFGTSENAVKTQIWISVGAYVLSAIVRKKLELQLSLNTILQIFSLTLFEKTEDFRGFLNDEHTISEDEFAKQLEFKLL